MSKALRYGPTGNHRPMCKKECTTPLKCCLMLIAAIYPVEITTSNFPITTILWLAESVSIKTASKYNLKEFEQKQECAAANQLRMFKEIVVLHNRQDHRRIDEQESQVFTFWKLQFVQKRGA